MVWIPRSELRGPVGTFDQVTAKALPAGVHPTATIGGSPQHRTVEFGIPEGKRGLPGLEAVPTDEGLAVYLGADDTASGATVNAKISKGVGEQAVDAWRNTPVHLQTLPVSGLSAPSGGAVQVSLEGHTGGNQATHPSVLHFPDGWNGYRYWMAFTPYPGGNEAHEDPCVNVSYDGTHWFTPDGLTNPLDDAPGTSSHNSDTELVMSPDGNTMHLVWRERIRTPSEEEILWMRSSVNGIIWTPKMEIARKSELGRELLSPAIVHDGTRWLMWAVDSSTSPNQLVRYTASDIVGPWSSGTVCTVEGMPVWGSPRDIWHISVVRAGGQYVMALNDVTLGTSGSGGHLRLASSVDGIAWSAGQEVIPRVLPGQHNSLYRASLVPTSDAGVPGFDVWYGAYMMGSPTVWGIYRSRVTVATGEMVVSPAELSVLQGSPELASVGGSLAAWLMPAGVNTGISGVVSVPSDWEAFNVFVECAVESGAGVAAVRLNHKMYGVGDNAVTGSTVGGNRFTEEAGVNVVQLVQVASRVVAEPGKRLRIVVGRRGAEAADTLTGGLYVLSVILRRTSS